MYFKNLGNNSGAFHSLLDSSEEEEIKETLLVYAFLLCSEGADAQALDAAIEEWFMTEFESALDFDIQDALQKLNRIGIAKESEGVWKAMPLNQAVTHVDEIWDGLFA
ncbi:MAG: hypothetical protein RIT43_1102 [Bacteroidota bacterium]